jgi:hypothetical protein
MGYHDRIFHVFRGFCFGFPLTHATRNTREFDRPRCAFISIEGYVEFHGLCLVVINGVEVYVKSHDRIALIRQVRSSFCHDML